MSSVAHEDQSEVTVLRTTPVYNISVIGRHFFKDARIFRGKFFVVRYVYHGVEMCTACVRV